MMSSERLTINVERETINETEKPVAMPRLTSTIGAINRCGATLTEAKLL